VRAFLAGEDEIVARGRQHCDDGLAGEEIVAEIDGTQRAKPFAGVPFNRMAVCNPAASISGTSGNAASVR
jgi:hypothetical protein